MLYHTATNSELRWASWIGPDEEKELAIVAERAARLGLLDEEKDLESQKPTRRTPGKQKE